MHTIISPFPRTHLFLHKNQLGKLQQWPSVCHWMDPKMFGQWGWRSSCQLKQTCGSYFLVSLWKSVGKKRQPFDRWNSNSCQLRLWLKIIPLWVQNCFWLNYNFKVKWFHYVQLQLWLSARNQAGGEPASIPVCTLKQTHWELRLSTTVFKQDFWGRGLHRAPPLTGTAKASSRRYRFWSQCSQKCCLPLILPGSRLR